MGIKNKIRNEIERNQELIEELEYKLKVLYENSFKERLSRIEKGAVISWIGIMLTLVFNINRITIPLELLSCLTLSIPALIGYTVERIWAKKCGKIDEFKNITSARTNIEIQAEEIVCNIEKIKLMNKNIYIS